MNVNDGTSRGSRYSALDREKSVRDGSSFQCIVCRSVLYEFGRGGLSKLWFYRGDNGVFLV